MTMMVKRNCLLLLVALCLDTPDGFVIRDQATKCRGVEATLRVSQSADATVCFPVQVNEFFKNPVPSPFKDALSVYNEQGSIRTSNDIVTLLTAAPSSPGYPRQLWLVVLASLPTGLLWYGYYFFAIQEELLQIELNKGKEPRGFGGYGTLGPFSYAMLLGPVAVLFDIPGGINWILPGIIFIYYQQFLLLERINDLYKDEGLDEPLQPWWSLPIFFPFNLIVGLRQIHFLAQYFYIKRDITNPPKDPIADFFPFVASERFTWQDFLLSPKLWCSRFSDVEDFDLKQLPKPIQNLLTCRGPAEFQL